MSDPRTARKRTPESYRKSTVRAIGVILPWARAIARGERTPTPADELLLRGLLAELHAARLAERES